MSRIHIFALSFLWAAVAFGSDKQIEFEACQWPVPSDFYDGGAAGSMEQYGKFGSAGITQSITVHRGEEYDLKVREHPNVYKDVKTAEDGVFEIFSYNFVNELAGKTDFIVDIVSDRGYLQLRNLGKDEALRFTGSCISKYAIETVYNHGAAQ